MEQIDTLLNGRKIIQDPQRFQFGIDAVLLANFAAKETRNNDKVIDLGTGTGIIPILMETSCKAAHFTGLEIQQESAQMATRSVELNQLSSKIQIVQGDIKSVSSIFPKHSFNVVTSNPPYMINEHGRQNDGDAKSIARHEVLCNFDDLVSAADYLLLPRGKFFLIHRPFRLPEIFITLKKYNFEAKRMRLVYPFVDKEPNMVLIEARKNARPELKIEPPLIVRYNQGPKKGLYTDEVEAIYNSSKASSKESSE
ncbi:MAG: tRNA1(Val) (adenine(37)-N6)-methyltransferase [Treponema sp.]|nr:tRNA1(Val) (adenine(37)-N6)-methyltransferase [Treponema sp.]